MGYIRNVLVLFQRSYGIYSGMALDLEARGIAKGLSPKSWVLTDSQPTKGRQLLPNSAAPPGIDCIAYSESSHVKFKAANYCGAWLLVSGRSFAFLAYGF